MAVDAQKVIELVFNGVDKTSAATQSALRNVGAFAGNVQSATQPVADLTTAALRLEAGILAAGAAAVVFSVHTAGEFDMAFRQISTLVKASKEDMDGFKESVLSYASTSSMPLDDITGALSAAIGSGVEWSKSLELISTAEKLAVATRADLKGTTEVLVSTMNAYGMQTSKAGELSDLFFQIIADGKIEMTDLSQYLANITPISAAAGVSMKEVGAAIATLTAGGMQPSTAIDALKSALSNMIKPSKEASDLASELGIKFDASALKSKGLAGVLNDVAKATGGSTEKMAVLFGDVTGLASVLSLTGAQAGKFKESIESMGNSAGAVAEAFKKMTDSVDQSTAKINNAFTVLLVRIGTPLLNEFGGISKAIVEILNAMGASVKDGNLGGLVGYIEGQMAGLQATLETVARNMPAALEGADFSDFKNGIDVVLGAIKKLFGEIDLSTVDGLKSAIELAGAAFLGLSSYVAGVVDSFKPLFDKLVEVGSGLNGVDDGFLRSAGEMAGFVTQANALAGGLNSLLPALEGLVGLLIVRQGIGLAGALGVTTTAVTGLAMALGPTALVAAAGAAGYGVGTLLKEPIDGLVSSMTGSKTTLGGWIYDLTHGGEAAADMGGKAAGATAGVDKLGESVGKVSKAADDIRNPFKRANEVLLENFAASQKVEQIVGTLPKFFDSAGKSIKGIVPVIDEATGEVVGYEQAMAGLEPIFDEATGQLIRWERSVTAGGAATKTTTEETKKAEDATKKWNEEVAKMNFQEKLKLIESQTKIMTAQIEADAKKTVAAFESISATMESTGDVLSSLFGMFKDFSSMDWAAIDLIKDQIERENKLREDAFKLQKSLTEAQIAQMKAQTDALLKGDGLIKIDGAGLKPHLEAFMWEILRAIQVRVNKDGLKMLLGV